MIININENRERAKLYSKEKTFTFIDECLPNGIHHYYNGFIIEVKDDLFVFFDVVSKIEFPVYLDKCLIEPSKNREISLSIAREIMYEFYKNEENGNGRKI